MACTLHTLSQLVIKYIAAEDQLLVLLLYLGAFSHNHYFSYIIIKPVVILVGHLMVNKYSIISNIHTPNGDHELSIGSE